MFSVSSTLSSAFTVWCRVINRPSILLSISILLLVFGCAHRSNTANKTAKRDHANSVDWIVTLPAEFAGEYLSAIGGAPTVEQAQDNARANIAKIFSVRVRQQSYQSTQVSENNKRQQVRKYGGENTRALTDGIVEGIEIVRRGFNQSDQQWYALAVLSKTKASRLLFNKMSDLDDAITRHLQADVAPLARIGELRAAVDLFAEQSRLAKQYAIVSKRPYQSIHKNYPFAQALSKARRQVRIAVIVVTEQDRRVLPVVTDLLAKRGYQVDSGGAYQLVLNAQLSAVDKRIDWFWQTMTLDWQIQKGSSLLGNHRLSVRAASVEKALLAERLAERLRIELAQPLITSLEIAE